MAADRRDPVRACISTPPVDARTKQGDKLLKLGAKAEADQDYDKAVTYFEQALQEDSREPAYQLAAQRAKAKASDQHLVAGRKLLEQQKLNEALMQFQKAMMIDPSSPVALQLVMQTNEMIKEKTKAPDGDDDSDAGGAPRREIGTAHRYVGRSAGLAADQKFNRQFKDE